MSTVSNSSGKHTVLRSASREVVIGSDQPFCLIGERLNLDLIHQLQQSTHVGCDGRRCANRT